MSVLSGSDDARATNMAAGAAATVGVCAFVVLVSLASCTVPLRSALRIDPMQALRSDA